MDRFFYFLIYLFVFIFNSATQAAVTQVDASGTISEAYGFNYDSNSGLINYTFSNDIEIGDSFSYRFSFNETNSAESNGSGVYNNGISSFSGQVGTFTFSGNGGIAQSVGYGEGNYHFFTTNHYDSGYSPRSIDHIVNTSRAINGAELRLINFLKYDNNGVAPGSPNYNLTRNNISDLIDNSSYYNNYVLLQFFNFDSNPNPFLYKDYYYVLGKFDTVSITIADDPSPVPIPAAVWLFCSGLISIFGIQKKRLK